MITEKIEKIVDKRSGRGEYAGRGHLDAVKKQKDFFLQLIEKLKIYQTFRQNALRQIEECRGENYATSSEDPAFEDKVRAADPDILLSGLDKAVRECDRLIHRFSRDTVNISVIGRAGQGKSTLLQSISGLDDEIIPSAPNGDCTGAKSIICNYPGPGTYAEITFYSEKELLEQLQKYLDALDIPDILGAAGDILRIDLGKAAQKTARQTSLLGHLEKYVDHYQEYRDFLGQVRRVDQEADIRNYVAQYDVNHKPIFMYLAVKEVRIYTPFRFSDAGRITLVDTIGLGDTSLGIQDKMMDALVNDSDAAIIIRMPNKFRDGIREEDNELYDSIASRMEGRDIEKWLFYVLNVFQENKENGDILFKSLMSQRGKGALKVASLLQLDCADDEAVEKNLVMPVLDSIAKNLESIDSGLLEKANRSFAELYVLLFDLTGKIRAVLNNSFRKSMNMGGLFDRLFKSLPLFSRLRDLNASYAETRNEKCTDVENDILLVLGKISGYCPGRDEILEQLQRGTIDAQPDVVYSHYADHLRAEIANQFGVVTGETLQSLQNKVKTDIIDILYSDDGGCLGNVPLSVEVDPADRTGWLKEFIGEKLDGYPAVKNAFEYILDYRLNIEGLIEYKVNTSLEFLDPISEKFCRIDPRGLSDEENAELIEQSLLNAIGLVADDLLRQISDMLVIPSNAFFACIRKFREMIAYSDEGNDELKELYRDNCVAVWKEEFSRQISTQTALGAWSDYDAELSGMCVRENFKINIA